MALADKQTAPEFVRYWSNSGQIWILARDFQAGIRVATSEAKGPKLRYELRDDVRREIVIAFDEHRLCFAGTKFESGTLFPFATWSCELVRRDDADEPIQERELHDNNKYS